MRWIFKPPISLTNTFIPTRRVFGEAAPIREDSFYSWLMITHWFFEMAVAFRAKRILDRINKNYRFGWNEPSPSQKNIFSLLQIPTLGFCQFCELIRFAHPLGKLLLSFSAPILSKISPPVFSQKPPSYRLCRCSAITPLLLNKNAFNAILEPCF